MSSNKLTKDELKDIVKVCLVEILEEGLLKSSSLVESKNKRQKRRSQPIQQKKDQRKDSYLNKIAYKKSAPKINTNLSTDSLINEMLADTAKSTLQEQIAADRKKNVIAVSNVDNATMQVANNELNDLFGNEAADKWSKLAFFDKN